jgi:hypothetical protein
MLKAKSKTGLGWTWHGELKGVGIPSPGAVFVTESGKRLAALKAAKAWIQEQKAIDRPKIFLHDPSGPVLDRTPKWTYTWEQQKQRRELRKKRRVLEASINRAEMDRKQFQEVGMEWTAFRDKAIEVARASLKVIDDRLEAMIPGVDDTPKQTGFSMDADGKGATLSNGKRVCTDPDKMNGAGDRNG